MLTTCACRGKPEAQKSPNYPSRVLAPAETQNCWQDSAKSGVLRPGQRPGWPPCTSGHLAASVSSRARPRLEGRTPAGRPHRHWSDRQVLPLYRPWNFCADHFSLVPSATPPAAAVFPITAIHHPYNKQGTGHDLCRRRHAEDQRTPCRLEHPKKPRAEARGRHRGASCYLAWASKTTRRPRAYNIFGST